MHVRPVRLSILECRFNKTNAPPPKVVYGKAGPLVMESWNATSFFDDVSHLLGDQNASWSLELAKSMEFSKQVSSAGPLA